MRSNLSLHRTSWLWLLLALGVVILGCAKAGPPAQASESVAEQLRRDIASGKIVVVYRMSETNSESEQYADWSSYINDFARSKGNSYGFYASDKSIEDLLKRNGIEVEEEYTFFFKAEDVAYVYDGVILEPAVYVSVDRAYSKTPLTDMDRAFLPEPKRITIEK